YGRGPYRPRRRSHVRAAPRIGRAVVPPPAVASRIPSRLLLPTGARLVGLHYALDQGMAHDILGIEEGEGNSLHAAQYADHVTQARLPPRRQVGLSHIAGH